MNPEAPVMMRRGNSIQRNALYMFPRPCPRPKWGMGSRGSGNGEPCFQRNFILFHKNWSDADADSDAGLYRYTSPVHEMGIALEVYRTCRETVEAHGGGRLRQARVAVGELSAVEPELLVYAWEAVVEDGPDVGAELIIEWHPADQRCAACGEAKDRATGSWMRICPDCGMPLEVSGGSELDVIDLSFEETEEAG